MKRVLFLLPLLSLLACTVPKNATVTVTEKDGIQRTQTRYFKGYKKLVLVTVDRKDGCLLYKSKVVTNVITTYATPISHKEVYYDSLHCNRVVSVK